MTAPGNPSQAEPSVYRFRAMSAHDLAMVNVWLERPHVRAYTAAGFRADREVDTPDGRALLMIRDRDGAGR